jgi:hypothetical protein
MTLTNSIYAGHDSNSSTETDDSGDESGFLDHNAYYLVTPTGATDDGYDEDPSPVELGYEPVPGAMPDPDSPLVEAGTDTTSLLGGHLEYDYYGRPRRSGTPTIGPVEAIQTSTWFVA